MCKGDQKIPRAGELLLFWNMAWSPSIHICGNRTNNRAITRVAITGAQCIADTLAL